VQSLSQLMGRFLFTLTFAWFNRRAGAGE